MILLLIFQYSIFPLFQHSPVEITPASHFTGQAFFHSYQSSNIPLFQHSILPICFRYCLYLFTFCGIVSLNSCITTSIVPIRVYDPPEVKFPDSTYHITLVNRLYFPPGNESYNKRKRNRIDSLAMNSIALEKLFIGIEDALYSSELIDTVIIVQKPREMKHSMNFDIELKPMKRSIADVITKLSEILFSG